MPVDVSPIGKLVNASLQDLKTKALHLHRLEAGYCDADLTKRFEAIEQELRDAIQALIDLSVDDRGLTAI